MLERPARSVTVDMLELLLRRLPWVMIGACLSCLASSLCQQSLPSVVWQLQRAAPGVARATARRLREEQTECRVSAELTDILGINASLLADVQDDLLRRWGSRSDTSTPLYVMKGPLKRYYTSPAQDLFVRLHQLLFALELLPLSAWGGRSDFAKPMPRWLKRAASAGRGLGGTLSRLGLNAFLLEHEHRVPANATCLGVDVAGQYLPIFSGCRPEQMWSLKYMPDNPAAPRQPRLNQKRRLLHLDLMSVQSAALAGKAHEKFDLAVMQETFEHIRFPYRAATALYHLLRPGGMVLWTAPFSTRFHLIPGDYFRYSFDGARALFVNAGFRIAGLAKFGDSAMSSGYNLGFGSADFTSTHLAKRLVQNVTQPDGKASWACSNAEAHYISSAVAAVKMDGGQRASLGTALKMG